MKTNFPYILFFVLFIYSCDKNDDQPQSPIDQLPPATQTGEQTFGCLIDGEPFISDNFGRGRPSAFYQYIDGKYTFNIGAYKSSDSTLNVAIAGRNIEGLQESIFRLIEEEDENIFGKLIISKGGIQLNSSSLTENPGELIITNFDPDNFILSGTFEFTVLDEEGNEIEITDGRFDVKYTN
ncbi:hypothetical protein [uncultured Salegentibacter sp.]|uniref:hypothetical protein n=1 Tax=uncultured Salegentibacter sp. TaxID=259320 RepID=UPI002592B483|nr:hypothetical protein [uncultured Salegentibacter sp.]